MHIVLTQAVADELRHKYTVLELDTMPHPDGPVPAFCVLPVEKIVLEMSQLRENIALHEQLIQCVKNDNCAVALILVDQLIGKFGGELDTFYQEIKQRIETTKSTILVIGQTFS
jgi:hypothetical protein